MKTTPVRVGRLAFDPRVDVRLPILVSVGGDGLAMLRARTTIQDSGARVEGFRVRTAPGAGRCPLTREEVRRG